MTWKTTEGGLREYLRHFDTEDLVIYHDFWSMCPRCDSLNTHEVQVTHPYTGVEVVRKCDNCGKEWMTKVYDNDYLDEFDDGDYEGDAPIPVMDEDPCHDWETIWDDGVGQCCCVCTICGEEQVFHYDYDPEEHES